MQLQWIRCCRQVRQHFRRGKPFRGLFAPAQFLVTDLWFERRVLQQIGRWKEPTEDLTGRLPIINMIELRSGQRVVRMQQEIVPSAAGREVANTLALAEGTPLLLARRSYFSRSGRIVELAEVHYHPDRYKYLTEYTKCGT